MIRTAFGNPLSSLRDRALLRVSALRASIGRIFTTEESQAWATGIIVTLACLGVFS